MLADYRLHRLSARHSRLLPHKRSNSTQCEAPCTSNFPKNSGPYSVLVLHLVHDGKMFLLLIPHLLMCPIEHLVRDGTYGVEVAVLPELEAL